jgi:hypothetical protein
MKSRRKSKTRKSSRTVQRCALPATLALLLSAIGALGVIELRPQIEVIPEQEVEPGQPFSAPFQVENTGYSSLYIERIFFCVRHVQWGGAEIRNSVVSYDRWANTVLDRGQGESISSHLLQSGIPPDEADVVIVIDNRPSKLFPQTERRYFRFTRFDGPYRGLWAWLKQPSHDIQADVDEQIQQWRRSTTRLRPGS